jgi:hypothetical protein
VQALVLAILPLADLLGRLPVHLLLLLLADRREQELGRPLRAQAGRDDDVRELLGVEEL